MSPKFLLVSVIGIYFLVCNVQAQIGLGDENLSSSIQEILAQARRLENEDEDGIGYSASNQHGRQASHQDLTSVLGVDKKRLYQDFISMQEDIDNSSGASESEDTLQPVEGGPSSYSYDY